MFHVEQLGEKTMLQMDIEVTENLYDFYLSFPRGWRKLTGRMVIIDEFRFSAVPYNGVLKVSEVESGALIFELALPDEDMDDADTMRFLTVNVGARLAILLEEAGPMPFRGTVERLTAQFLEELGPKPANEPVDLGRPSFGSHIIH